MSYLEFSLSGKSKGIAIHEMHAVVNYRRVNEVLGKVAFMGKGCGQQEVHQSLSSKFMAVG